MTTSVRELLPPSCVLFAIGEPVHNEPAFGRARNRLLEQLVDAGARAVALETDAVAALAVDRFVNHGDGDLDEVLRVGFSHGFGGRQDNRELLTWLRRCNERRAPADRVRFHGFDGPMENTTAPSPRTYLEAVRDHLGLDLDITDAAGDDGRWSRQEAILDPAQSLGAGPEAGRLRTMAGQLHTELWARAPERLAASPGDWWAARARLLTAEGLLRYHHQAAQPLELPAQMSGLLAARDALMAEHLSRIVQEEADRGPVVVHAHNLHLQRARSVMRLPHATCRWWGAGAIVAAELGERYTFVAAEAGPADGTDWTLLGHDEFSQVRSGGGAPGAPGYLPPTEALDGADALLLVATGPAAA